MKHKRKKGGFTLAEIVVGFAVMGILIASVFSVVGQGVGVVELSRDYARVAQIMQSEIEELRKLSWARIQELPENEDFVPDLTFVDVFGDRYQCRRLIQTTKTGQVRITVIVDWDDFSGRAHQRRYITLMTREGLNDYYYRAM